jgi:hypothetical protein
MEKTMMDCWRKNEWIPASAGMTRIERIKSPLVHFGESNALYRMSAEDL